MLEDRNHQAIEWHTLICEIILQAISRDLVQLSKSERRLTGITFLIALLCLQCCLNEHDGWCSWCSTAYKISVYEFSFRFIYGMLPGTASDSVYISFCMTSMALFWIISIIWVLFRNFLLEMSLAVLLLNFISYQHHNNNKYICRQHSFGQLSSKHFMLEPSFTIKTNANVV